MKVKGRIKMDDLSIFDKIDTLVITGAGFSYDANLPLEKDVIPRGLDICNIEKPEIIDSIKYHAQHLLNIDNIFDLSIEEILTKIKMIELYSISKYDYVRDIMPFEQSVLRLFSKTLELSKKNKLLNFYFDFLKKFKNNTAFATFNNDFLLEKIFSELQIFWTFTIEDENVEIQFGINDFYYKSQESGKYKSRPPIIPYLKLH